MFEQKTIFITGGTGSWGKVLTEQLLTRNPKTIIVYSRNEDDQVAMQRSMTDPRLRFIIGDVRDKEALMTACRGADILFHLAALKHVPVCEAMPLEALKTNVIGTQNVIDAAIANTISRVIYVSTDKAADPSNYYGMTKALGEKMMVQANAHGETRFMCVRGGNVLGTKGSVVHAFREQLSRDGVIRLTDSSMTRFFQTPDEAISLLIHAAEHGIGGEIVILNMPTFSIQDLAHVMIDASGTPGAIEVTGRRPGEKLHEVLVGEEELARTKEWKDGYYVVLPQDNDTVAKHYAPYPFLNRSSVSSADHLQPRSEIAAMLKRAKLL